MSAVSASQPVQKLCEHEPLYSEGGLRPYWRGKFHLVVGIIFFFAFFVLLQKAETATEIMSTSLFSLINMASYITSYSYHCINWSPTTEVPHPLHPVWSLIL
jgi:hypothetical protein